MHDYKGDEAAFYLEKDPFRDSQIVDMQLLYARLNGARGRGPGLRAAAKAVLGKDVQIGDVHCPIEDARTTMELYQNFYRDGEAEDCFQAMKAMSEKIVVEKARKAARLAAEGNGHVPFSELRRS